MQNESFKVINVSAVLVANQHNPTIMNQDFLKSKEIVKPEWETADLLVTNLFARIVYSNGISFTVDPNRCAIDEKVDGEFKSSYEAHGCARRYAEVLEHIPYTAFGLNWDLQMPNEEPSNWLKDRFLRPAEWQSDMEPKALTFSCTQGSAIYNFAIGVQQSTGHESLVTLQCNIHFDLQDSPHKAAEISNAVQNLKEHQDSLQKILDRCLIGSTS